MNTVCKRLVQLATAGLISGAALMAGNQTPAQTTAQATSKTAPVVGTQGAATTRTQATVKTGHRRHRRTRQVKTSTPAAAVAPAQVKK